MLVSIASFKGGVGKTTTAVHLSAYFQKKGKTVLVDGDPNRSALAWSERGNFSFQVIDESELADRAGEFNNIIIDTPARPTAEELKTLSTESDLLLIPTKPDALSLDALLKIVTSLQSFDAQNYKVLLTLVPPRSNAARDAKAMLDEIKVPYCKTEIQRRAICERAALQGKTVDNLRDGQAAWEEFTTLGKEIFKR
ncbi:ParA family protein [soil metagenome]